MAGGGERGRGEGSQGYSMAGGGERGRGEGRLFGEFLKVLYFRFRRPSCQSC
jgi:hypothetical protein